MKVRALAVALSASIVATVLTVLTACGGHGSSTRPLRDVVRVPQDASSISAGVALVKPGGLVLVGRGVYRESVTILKKDVTLRGADRNEVVLDGEGKRSNGVVAGAAGVTIENLTVRRYLLNGVLVTGVVEDHVGIGRGSDGYHHLDTAKFPPVPGFAVRYVTAVDNGLYGIYAFNRHHGSITHTYSSGSADSGLYVGQCEGCDIVVSDNVAEYNAVGYENANASGVTVARNRFTDNRVGLTMLSDYQEAYAPQRRSVLVGNLVSDNDQPQTPEQADGGFGIGIGLAGTDGVVVQRNRVEGNGSFGLVLTPSEDLPAVSNTAAANAYARNGLDVALSSSTRSGGTKPNCLTVPASASTHPDPLPAGLTCAGGGAAHLPAIPAPDQQPAPPGIAFLDVPAPGPLPTMPGDPAVLPHGAAADPERIQAGAVPLPSPTLLAGEVRTR